MLPNLTRNEAVERAALVTVDRYRIELDLTGPGDKEFRSVTTVKFEALPGADTYIDLAADRVHRAVLNGHEIDVTGYDESTGIPLRGLAQHNVLVVEADCRYSHTGRACTASSTRSTARCTCTRNSRPPTPSGCSPASTSPTSRPSSTSSSPRRRTGR